MNKKVFLSKISKHYGKEIPKVNLLELEKIHNQWPNDNFFNWYKVFSEQIALGIANHYDRYKEAKEKIKSKDSSSLKQFIIKYGEVEGNRKYKDRTSKMSPTLSNFVKKYGEEEGTKRYRLTNKRKCHSLEGYILRNGVELGTKKFKEYWSSTNCSTKLEAFIRRHGEVEGKLKYEEFCKNQAFNNTLEGRIKKYGEKKGTILYHKWLKKKNKNSSKDEFIKKLLKQNFSMEDIQELIENRWSRSLQTYVKKFGETEGKKRYENFCKSLRLSNPACREFYEGLGLTEEEIYEKITMSLIENNHGGKTSKESLHKMLPIMDYIKYKFNTDFMFGAREFYIKLKKEEHDSFRGRGYFYDFTFPDLKLIVEYHGKHWHKDLDYDSTKNKTFEEIFETQEYDLIKKWVAEDRGYEVIIVRSWRVEEDKERLMRAVKMLEEKIET